MNLYPEFMPEQNETALYDSAQNEAILARNLHQALARQPEPHIPAGFAARVAASLPPAPKPRPNAQVGRLASIAAAAVLAVALFALAPHAAPTFGNLAFDLELVILAQLAGISYWLTARRGN